MSRVELYDLQGLPESLYPELARFNVTDGDSPHDVRLLHWMRRLGYPASDYTAVYAVEGRTLLSRVETIRLPFRSARGRETVSGVTGVLTRPDAIGRGLSRKVFDEVHRRERKAGFEWVFLWTHRTWGAHELYLKMRYRDVYSPPSAVRQVKKRESVRRAVELRYRRAREPDARLLERLLSQATRGRWGFVPRYSGSFRLKFLLGWRSAADHLIFLRDEEPVAYAYARTGEASLVVNEVVTTTEDDARAIVETLERMARGRWLTFAQTSFVDDQNRLLSERGYAILRPAHLTLMAKRLDGRPVARDALRSTFDTPEFVCQRGDIF